MRRLLPHHTRQQHCEFMQQDEKGHWNCGLLQLSGQPVAIVSPRGGLEWATSSAHRILSRYWPDHHPLETRFPHQIRKWMDLARKKASTRKGVAQDPALLAIDTGQSRLVVRSILYGTCAVLLFEESESLFDLPVNRLVSLGLTPREAEVLRWLMQGKSTPEISAILSISPQTVSKLLTRVYRQLGVENRHAAVSSALEAVRSYKNNSPKAFRQVKR